MHICIYVYNLINYNLRKLYIKCSIGQYHSIFNYYANIIRKILLHKRKVLHSSYFIYIVQYTSLHAQYYM